MGRLDEIFARADFSKETDFKNVLRQRLFGETAQEKSGYDFRRLSMDDIALINAAGDIGSIRSAGQPQTPDEEDK